MNALHESSDRSKKVDLVTTCEQPTALPVDLPNWTIDDWPRSKGGAADRRPQPGAHHYHPSRQGGL